MKILFVRKCPANLNKDSQCTGWLAQVVECQSLCRRLMVQTSDWTNTQISITKENVLPLKLYLQMVRPSQIITIHVNCRPDSCIFCVTWLAGYVKEPTHLSKREGHVVPGVVVWPCLKD